MFIGYAVINKDGEYLMPKRGSSIQDWSNDPKRTPRIFSRKHNARRCLHKHYADKIGARVVEMTLYPGTMEDYNE